MTLGHLLYGFVTQERTYDNRSSIIKEGEENLFVYIILEGQCRVTKRTQEGAVVLDTLKRGAIIGEMVLFERASPVPAATVVADGPVKVGLLDPDQLAKALEKISPQTRNLIESLVVSLRKANVRAAQVAV
ncbi:MAG: cyclic nucleotide-binding domain-containing protein [Thermodesulfobacteriota bacterium]